MLTNDQQAALGLLQDALRGTVHSIRPTRDDDGRPRLALVLPQTPGGIAQAQALRAQGFALDLLRAVPLGPDLAAHVYVVALDGVAL